MSKKDNAFDCVEAKECFAELKIEKEVLTNPTQLLLDGEKLRMLRLCGERVEGASDYELFERFVNSLPMMRGSGVYELFFEELRLFFDYEVYGELPCAAELWRALCDKIEGWGYGYPDSLAPKTPPHISLDIEGCEDIESLIAENLRVIALSESDIATVDISDVAFEKSDKYHAALAYSEYLGGNAQKKGAVLWGVLYRICESLRANGRTLFVYVGDNYDAAEKMLEYFSGRGILPDIRLFSSGKTLTRLASKLCGAYGDDSRSVLCGLVYESGDTVKSIAKSVEDVARVYPVARLYLGGSVTDTPSASARLEILKKGFRIGTHGLIKFSIDND